MPHSSTQTTFPDARRFTVQMSANQAEHRMYLAARGTIAADKPKNVPVNTVSSVSAKPKMEGQVG